MNLRLTPGRRGGPVDADPAWPGKPQRAKIVQLELAEPAHDVHVPPEYDLVLVIVLQQGSVLGHAWLPAPADGVLSATLQAAAAADRFGRTAWHHSYRQLLDAAARGPAPEPGPNPSVAVAVCTRDRPELLCRCLDRLIALDPPPDEIVVVDNCPSDERTRELCASYPVRYIVEPIPGQTRARNRAIAETDAELVAFTDDDCEPDDGWLRGLAEPFSDPLVMAVTGYLGPAELDEPSQVVFERHYSFGRAWTRTVYATPGTSPLSGAAVAGAGANMILRRRGFELLGMYPEYLGPGTPARSSDDKYFFYRIIAAGYRIVHEPTRKVWHRHRADHGALERIMKDYGVAEFAYATLCLVKHRELAAVRIFWWWLKHFARDLWAWVRRRPGHLDFRLATAELRGAAIGPFALVRSLRSRRDVPPIELPAATAKTPPRIAVQAGLPPLTVTVATYERRDTLRTVLEHLADQTIPSDAYEVLVVVDGSTDGSAEMARSLDLPYRLRVLEQENRGLAATRNRGAREAAHDTVVFLDDDLYATPGFVEAHAAASRDAEAGSVGLGYCPPLREPTTFWAGTLRTWWEDHYRSKGERDHQWTFVDFADGNLSISRELLLSVGGYDEDFDGDRRHDWELGERLLQSGAPFVYLPAAKALHDYDPRFATALRNQHDSGRLDVLLASKHPHLVARLPLGAVAWRLGEDPAAVERLVAAGTGGLEHRERRLRVPLRAFAAVHARRAWLSRAYALLHDAYTLGVVDACGGLTETRSLLDLRRIQADRTDVRLALEGAGRIHLPPRAGGIQLGVELDGRMLGSVDALQPGTQWNWDWILDRLAYTTSEPARVRLAARGMEDLAAAADGGLERHLRALTLDGHA